MIVFRLPLLAFFCSIFALSGCGGGVAAVKPEPPKYADYDCSRLFKAMEYKVDEANLLYTNYEDENSAGKVGTGILSSAAGAAMASSLILTPVGWVLAGGLMLGGASQMLDGMSHDELSDAEQSQLRRHQAEYEEMRKVAMEKKCDYYAIPKWDVSPERARNK